jgi:ABC-type sulfate/molybdate transport systems ATPase subunit
VIEIAAFALRVAALILTKPNPRKLLVLDEPFKAVHVSYLPRVRELIEVLAEEMDIQFIIITHNELLEAGKVIQLG